MGRFQPIVASLFALALAACGSSRVSGGFVPPAAPDQRLSTDASAGPVTLTITLPAIQPQNARVDWASGPNLLSAATRSVTGMVGTHAFGPVALSTSQTGCEATSGGLGCTFSIRVPSGDNQRLQLQTHASKNGTGPALATATLTLNVRPGAERFAAPHVFGIARRIAAGPLDATVHQGTWQPVPIVVYGVDAAKAPIPSAAVVDRSDARIESVAAVTLSGFVNATLKGSDDAPIACCGITDRTFSYDGLHAGRGNVHRKDAWSRNHLDHVTRPTRFEYARDDRHGQFVCELLDRRELRRTVRVQRQRQRRSRPVVRRAKRQQPALR